MENKSKFSKKIESLSLEQLKMVIQFLFDQSEYEIKVSANRIVEKMSRVNAEKDMQKADIKQLKEVIIRRLSEWKSLDEKELWINVSVNEEYDDWYDSEESEFDVEPAPGLMNGLETLLMDAESAGRNKWWTLAMEIIQAVYETPIEVTGDYLDGIYSLEYLEEYVWHDNLPRHTVEILLTQLLKDEQMEMHEKVDRMNALMEIARINPSILNELLQIDPTIPMTEKFLETWLETIMPSDVIAEIEKVNVFCETISLYEKTKDGESLLWIYGQYAPEVYEKYYKNHFIHRTPKQKIEYLKTALKNSSFSNEQKSILLDELATVYIEIEKLDLALDVSLESFSNDPTYNRYNKVVKICPDKQYLSLFASDWNIKIGMDAWLIEALEGKSEAIIKRLQDKKNSDPRKELTVLMGILCKGKIENLSLQQLIGRFLSEKAYYLLNSHEDLMSICQNQSFLFQRAFERAKWDQNDIRQLLDLALGCIDEYTEYILSIQARKEYFRCAQLIGAAQYAIEISGELKTFGFLRQRYENELRRYRRFKDEFYTWVI